MLCIALRLMEILFLAAKEIQLNVTIETSPPSSTGNRPKPSCCCYLLSLTSGGGTPSHSKLTADGKCSLLRWTLVTWALSRLTASLLFSCSHAFLPGVCAVLGQGGAQTGGPAQRRPNHLHARGPRPSPPLV